jgi:hypothetical protein
VIGCYIAMLAGSKSIRSCGAGNAMSDYFDEFDEIIAAASICPVCETLVLEYRSRNLTVHDSDQWDFMCTKCSTEFTVPESELAFQSLPREWLSAKAYAA